MKKYIVSLKGTSPIVFNTLQEELCNEIKKLKKDEYPDWEQNNWKRKAEKDKDGNVIIPIRWIKACFVNACKHSRKVPLFATTKKETYTRYAESLYFTDSSFKCKEKELIELKAYMGAQGAGSKTKVLKIYPKLDEWETTFKIMDGLGRMTIEEMKELFEFAGIIEGIGDFRKVNAGRFELVSLKEIQ